MTKRAAALEPRRADCGEGRMTISGFLHAKDNNPKHQETTWERFTKELGPHDYSVAEKDQVPLFCPAEFRPGTTRAAKNVARVWLFVGDFDHLSREQFDWVYQHVQASKLAAIVYTTWSHAGDPWRIRVIFALKRPVLPEEWGDFWQRMFVGFGELLDPKCKDPCRIYYVPCSPAGTEEWNFYHVFEGIDLLDPDLILGAAKKENVDPERFLAIQKLGEVWPKEGRHEAHLALSGGLLMSGVTNEEAIDILCEVAAAQDPDNEDRPKREATVDGTKARLEAGERVVGWTTLAKHIGSDVAMFAKQVLEAPPKISRDQLKQFAKSLKRKQNDALTDLGDALAKICDGEVYAEATNRHDVTLRLCNALGERFRDFDAKSIAGHFVPSFQLIGENNSSCPSEDDVVFSIKRKQTELKTREREKKLAETHQQSSRIREAFGNGRSTPYTQAELASFGDVSHQWIIRRGRSFYLFFNGEYRGPYTDDMANAAASHLAPASSANVQLHAFTKEGAVLKSHQRLVDEYGTVAEDAEIDLRGTKTQYDSKRRVIIEAPCPLRPISPRWHDEIDTWLQVMCGGGDKWVQRYGAERPNGRRNYIRLCKWLSVVTRLDRPCAALFLTGKGSIGKSMLPNGLSRLWTTKGATPLEEGFADFNDAILACPLTLADEQLPKDRQGYVRFGELRVHVQQRERALKRKHLPVARLIGATRTVIAANNERILETAENLSVDDIGAIAMRLLHIPGQIEAVKFLEQAETYENGWVDEDKIAEHALWLRDNYAWQDEGRFLVDCADERLVRSLLVRSGIRSAICQFLLGYLTNPRLVDARFEHEGKLCAARLVRTHNGELLANIHGIVRHWETYVGRGDRTPTMGRAASALATLSEPYCRRVEDLWSEDGRRFCKTTRYHVVNIENVIQWSELALGLTESEIRAALQRDPNAEAPAAHKREKDRKPFDGVFSAR